MAKPCVLCESKLWQNNLVTSNIRSLPGDEKNVLIGMLLDKHYEGHPELIEVHKKFGPDKVWDIPYTWNTEKVDIGFFSKPLIEYKSRKIRLCIYCLYVCYIDMYLTYDDGIKNIELKSKLDEQASFEIEYKVDTGGGVYGEYWESGTDKMTTNGRFHIAELLPPTNWKDVVDGFYSYGYENTVQLLKEINIDLNRNKGYYKNIVKQMIDKLTIVLKEEITQEQNQEKKYENDSRLIVDLLTERGNKITVSDIDTYLKLKNVDYTKRLCQDLYDKDKINFAGNSRYFVLTEEEEKSTKTSAPKSDEIDIKSELKKYKDMLDEGLITQEQYDAKSNKLLGL